MSTVVQFVTAADYALDTEERLVDLVDTLVELGQRLDVLEAMAVENAGADPLTEILARLAAFESRLATLEQRQRRPPPFPITVVEHVDSNVHQRMDDLSRGLATERSERARRDQDLHNQQQGFNGSMAAFNTRLNQCAAQFCRMRARVAAVEARTAGKGE
jgi:primosomal protein N''